MENGSYKLESNGTFGPNAPSWTWDQGEEMYAGSISGAQALSNGNVLVTHGTKGTLYEVNRDGEIVWEYIGPVGPNGTYVQGEPIPDGNRAGTTANAIFKATHYPVDHPAFANQTMTAMKYVEQWNDSCPEEEAWGWDKDGDGCIDDSDADGVLDPLDRCALGDDALDIDQDGIIDACDDLIDSDGDGVADENDLCEGHDDAVDIDQDGLPEPCDELVDSDNDTVPDDADTCEGHDDRIDVDNDSRPDGCDSLLDSDGDGVADSEDTCPDGDDNLDADLDGVPDACDASPLPIQNDNTSEDNDSEHQTVAADNPENQASILGQYPLALFLAGCGVVGIWSVAKRRSKP